MVHNYWQATPHYSACRSILYHWFFITTAIDFENGERSLA
jgi:hypothetical protein